MVSERQRLARKRFREEHGGVGGAPLHQKPTSSPEHDGGEKKKQKEKKDVGRLCQSTKFKRQSNKMWKHPLRVPGMKPGESCFICRGQDHVAKNCPTKATWEKKKICLLCRQRGHSLKNCPNSYEAQVKKKCYNCGEVGHSLSKCPQPLQDGGTKFAECFICKTQGHLSKNCPDNKHGIYPKGGCCQICGGLTHLAKDCPNKHNKTQNMGMGADRTQNGCANATQARRMVFSSGDDLEDDFAVDEHQEKESSSKGIPSFSNAGNHVNAKKKQGPKVVNFIG